MSTYLPAKFMQAESGCLFYATRRKACRSAAVRRAGLYPLESPLIQLPKAVLPS